MQQEKLPELREEFGLKKFVEANQGPGDLIIVPSGWFRVSLALADSFSYYAPWRLLHLLQRFIR